MSRFSRGAAAIVIFCFVAIVRADSTTGRFESLPLQNPPTTLDVTEDGKFLLISHESADAISVWDIAAGAVVKTLRADAPRPMLVRNGKLYVGCYGHGKIKIFNTRDWSVVDEVLTGQPDIVSLSAPMGAAFKNQLFATTKEQISILVDTVHDQHRELARRLGCIQISSDGQLIVNPNEGRPYKTQDVLAHGDEARDLGFTGTNSPYIYQARAGAFWFSDTTIFKMSPPAPVRGDIGWILVPDRTRDVVYALTGDKIEAFRLADTLDSLGSQPLDYGNWDPNWKPRPARAAPAPKPPEPAKPPRRGKRAAAPETPAVTRPAPASQPAAPIETPPPPGNPLQVFRPAERWYKGVLDVPIAITLDETVYVFYIDLGGRSVKAASFHAFAGTAATVIAKANGDAAATPAPPESIPPGKPFSYAIPVGPDVKLSLLTSPNGMTLNKNVLSWSPTNADIGTHPIKLRVDRNGDATFLRYNLAVGQGAAAAGAGAEGTSAAVAAMTTGLSVGDDDDFFSSWDHRSLYILSDQTLRRTDAHGQSAVETRTLPRKYIRMMERDAYFVALSKNTLDLVDKKTLEATKSINLNTPLSFDLAIHPTRRLAFVSVQDDDQGNAPRILSRRVYLVNEDTGEILKIKGAHGQHVAIDPLGRWLYVGLRDLYENGIVLDFDFGDIRPNYGDIDFVQAFSITDEMVDLVKVNVSPGVNGRCLRVAPDGKAVSYVSAAGNPALSYAVPALDPKDINKTLVSYSMKDQGFPQDIAYHPTLPLVCVITEQNVGLFARNSGDRVDNKFDPSPGPTKEMKRVLFSPDGASLLISTQTPDGRKLLAYPLNLTAQEKSSLNRTLPPTKSEPVRGPQNQPGESTPTETRPTAAGKAA